MLLGTGGGSVVEGLHSTHKALSTVPSTAEGTKRRGKERYLVGDVVQWYSMLNLHKALVSTRRPEKTKQVRDTAQCRALAWQCKTLGLVSRVAIRKKKLFSMPKKMPYLWIIVH
jgi:hypothetical protein